MYGTVTSKYIPPAAVVSAYRNRVRMPADCIDQYHSLAIKKVSLLCHAPPSVVIDSHVMSALAGGNVSSRQGSCADD